MLKKYFYFAMLMCASTFTFASCSDDDNEAPATPDESQCHAGAEIAAEGAFAGNQARTGPGRYFGGGTIR